MSPRMHDESAGVYYPAAIWTNGDWLKTALLFFDHVVLLRRDDRHSNTTVLDQKLVTALGEQGLVQITDPSHAIDDEVAAQLVSVLSDDDVWQALDRIGSERRFYYGARVFSTMNGPEPSLEMMEMRNVLLERIGSGAFVPNELGGYAYPTYRVGQQPTVPLHIRLWAPLMSVLPHYLRRASDRSAGRCVPITDHPSGGYALARLLDLPGMPSAGRVGTVELVPTVPDLGGLSWGDALAVRAEVRAECAGLIGLLKNAVTEPSTEHQEAVHSAAERIRRRVTALVGYRPLFQLGAVGSRWQAPEGETKGLAALARLIGGDGAEGTAYTVTFRRCVSIASPSTDEVSVIASAP